MNEPGQSSPPALPLVRDALPGERPPRRLHTADESLVVDEEASALDLRGLRELRASGSAQFTPQGLAALIASVPGPVMVIDARQESHGFLEGLPVTWYAERNWGNEGRSREDALADERRRLAELGAVTFAASKKDIGRELPAPELRGPGRSEQEVVAAAGARYVRLMVPDHQRPDDADVDRFVTALTAPPQPGHIYVHCRGGKGRSTTLLTLYDVLRNAGRVRLEDILARQRWLNGYDLMRAASPEDWKSPHREARVHLVHAFYDYVRGGAFASGERFSAWAARRRGTRPPEE